jgi:hypothetical protein
VPGATVVPVNGLGNEVRLLLGENYDGSVSAVRAAASATATMGSATATPTPTASSGSATATTPLTSINAGTALCA